MRVGVNGIQGPPARPLWQMLSARTDKEPFPLTGADARFPWHGELEGVPPPLKTAITTAPKYAMHSRLIPMMNSVNDIEAFRE